MKRKAPAPSLFPLIPAPPPLSFLLQTPFLAQVTLFNCEGCVLTVTTSRPAAACYLQLTFASTAAQSGSSDALYLLLLLLLLPCLTCCVIGALWRRRVSGSWDATYEYYPGLPRFAGDPLMVSPEELPVMVAPDDGGEASVRPRAGRGLRGWWPLTSTPHAADAEGPLVDPDVAWPVEEGPPEWAFVGDPWPFGTSV